MSSAEITSRGKAVSVSTRGNELRVWELEGGSGSRKSIPGSYPRSKYSERSVRIRPEIKDLGGEIGGGDGGEDLETGVRPSMMEIEGRKQWVGFDDEVVIVLKESGGGTQALMIYDFT